MAQWNPELDPIIESSDAAVKRIEGMFTQIDHALETSVSSEEDLEKFRIRYLGRRSGLLRSITQEIPRTPAESRKAYWTRFNDIKQRLEAYVERQQALLQPTSSKERTDLDLTLPGRVPAPASPDATGSLHPLTQTLREIEQIFARFGFDVATGPEIEDDWHNFTALNFPPEHPARDMQDTLFLEPPQPEGRGIVMRTHTSPAQIRVLERAVEDGSGPPVRVIVPGRVYRNEAISYKSFCLFHQVEGLVVDEGITFADLKEMLHVFARTFFGDEEGSPLRMRFRPSFFPFTEPSAEVDIWWADASLPEGGRWLEILGCGMVDPNVLEAVRIDPERYTGYAWGMGVERLAMLKYGVDDIRLFYENDVRFLKQF